jgi:hypothetical protein
VHALGKRARCGIRPAALLLGDPIIALGSLLLELAGQIGGPQPPKIVSNAEADQEREDSRHAVSDDSHGHHLLTGG